MINDIRDSDVDIVINDDDDNDGDDNHTNNDDNKPYLQIPSKRFNETGKLNIHAVLLWISAILKLDIPLVFTNYVQPLCLPRPDNIFAPNEECYVAGWGHTEWNGIQPDILREIKVRIVSREVCNLEQSYNGTIHNTVLCAGFPEGGIDACEYDSGGPLVCAKCGRHFAVGLVSWGDRCGSPHKYGVYSNVTVLTPWIIQSIKRYERGNSKINYLRG